MSEPRHDTGEAGRTRSVAWIAGAVVFAVATVALAAWAGRPRPLTIHTPSIDAALDLDIGRVRDHIATLASTPSRLTGSEGCSRALQYVRDELASFGITEIEVDAFPVAVPVVDSALLEVHADGRTVSLPLHPLWPNLVRTCRTPAEGIAGPLIDLGRATETELAGNPIRGAIAVLDGDAGTDWLSVPEFGGKAVIFRGVPDGSGALARRRFLTVPADVPRFYVERDRIADLDRWLQSANPAATITCRMEWRRVKANNLLARVVPGRASDAAAEDDRAPIVFHAYYDSISVVPTLAPGAEQACGAAVLLELARFFRTLPEAPPRGVYVLFTGGHGQAMAGMTRFTRRLRDAVDRGNGSGLIDRMGTPGLFVGLDLSSHSDQIGIFCGGSFRAQYEHILRPRFSRLAQEIDNFTRRIVAGSDSGAPDASARFVDCVNMTLGRGWWTYFPYRAGFESEIPTLAGFPGVTLGTVNDARRFVDTPADTLDRVRFDLLAGQVEQVEGRSVGLGKLALAFAYWKGPFIGRPLDNVMSTLRGRVVWLDQKRDYTPNRPIASAVVALKTGRGDKHMLGMRGVPVALADEQGRFEFDGLVNVTANAEFANVRLEAYGLASPGFLEANPSPVREYIETVAADVESRESIPANGSVIYAIDQSRSAEHPSQTQIRRDVQHLNLVTFPCHPVTLFGLTEPRGFISLTDLQILDASTDSPPFQWGISSTDSRPGDPEENCMTVWADPNLRVRLTLGFGFREKRLILVNNSSDDPKGSGYLLRGLETIPSWVLRGAESMWYLDESRLAKFEMNGIANPRVRRVHAEALASLDEARAALATHDYAAYRRAAERGWALESRAYGELLNMANNMIQGVLFYLVLLIPFSYALERLFFAAGTIRGRITGMLSVFVLSFAVLALVHPAFRFTLTPLLVLLAFVILALGVVVMFLIVSKVDAMLRARKRAALGHHEDTLAVSNVAGRAIDLGIANIRRRPQRGALTAATIVLVTFTLLSFTSLVPEIGISRLRHPLGVPTYRGLLARDRSWAPLPQPLYDSLRRHFDGGPPRRSGPSAAVAGRAWFFSDGTGLASNIDLARASYPRTDGADSPSTAPRTYTVSVLLGMEPAETVLTPVSACLEAGRWFADADELGIILTEHVARQLGLGGDKLGAPVLVFGQPLPLIGILRDGAMEDIRDIDGEPITPTDFAQQQVEDARGAADEIIDTLKEYVHRSADQVAIVPFRFARELGASIRSVAILADPAARPGDEAEAYVRRSNLTMLASEDGVVTLYASLNRSRMSAAGTMAVPLFLGFVMVLTTMLGSVYERRNEIFVYNSVGLSPTNVSSLFFAESWVYALIGASLGYLLGQMAAKILQTTGWLSGLNLNYSASAAVFTAALTMAIVLVSTVYPARQAFRAAVPEHRLEAITEQSEDAAEDRIGIYLPFVATASSIFAMQAYMYEFLDSAQGVSVGRIAVEHLRASTETEEGRARPVLAFRAWLAPFDLGVSHDARLLIVRRRETGVLQYLLTGVRFSGDQQNWRRLTPSFVMTLRQQLLFWRVLSAEDKEHYETMAENLFRVPKDTPTT